ncbi:hypothetical protein RHGRI_013766 [Rhododendron griersonianum]|uniref:non-specific serine/threonine protein kinase n=1 Tax=Rhododendron griersonianum TaxID=479676 RepID=A0AAV6K6U3_9ERIC|nr:hypothetical protein RHGRI_013766 [Rhododendron griersonianum]
MDLDYVLKIQWDSSTCNQTALSDSPTTTSNNNCCQTLLSLYGVALSQHLKDTSLFRLPDLPTSTSCLSLLQSKLTLLSLPPNLTSTCFHPQTYTNSTGACADIQTREDFAALIGPSSPLDPACRHDLSARDLTSCDACVQAGFKAHARLVSFDGNFSRTKGCYYYTVLYAAGVVNELGPKSKGALSCILALQMISPKVSETESSMSQQALVYGSAGAGGAVLVLCCLLGLCFWWRNINRNSLKVLSSFGLGSDDGRRWRPTAGAIWFKIQDLEKATGDFSLENLIGRGQFGVVYKGILPDGTTVAVKRVIESEIQGDSEFLNEVEIISTLKHRNLVALRGCCVTGRDENCGDGGGRKYLVYDYMPNGSLNDPGRVEEVFDDSLVSDGEFLNRRNPRKIMERFVLVGILCAHVMVALRPTILEALKMLEGDIDVPR